MRFPEDIASERLAEVLRLFFKSLPEVEFIDGAQEMKIECAKELSFTLTFEAGEVYSYGNGELFMTARPQDLKIAREMRRQLYLYLSKKLESQKNWGALTGVRPTMLVAELAEYHSGDRTAIMNSLLRDYGLTEAKAQLAIEVNEAEQTLLSEIPTDSDLVYIGIPYCYSRCSYCSFIAQDASRYRRLLPQYIDAITSDLKCFFGSRKSMVSSLYFGGGTPSSPDTKDIERLLQAVDKYVPLLPDAEITFEAGRADSLSYEKLKLIRDFGIERICLNPQTTSDETLQRIGRHHSVAEFYQAYEWISELGFQIINMDLICGLPGEDGADFLKSLADVMALKPANITVHALALKRTARLTQTVTEKRRENADLTAAMSQAHLALKEAGYKPYYLYRQKNLVAGLENTGFALPGTESKYNVGMMSDRRNVLGFGAGASSKAVFGERLERHINVKDIGLYIERWAGECDKRLQLFR
ncbi:MAG: coproporphyrinogen dehydrogenase HemZ [Eubacteriales bacterium]|nr:coproporphyrinogen dehydrogenase HemZ [Eubacteriales bacterium]